MRPGSYHPRRRRFDQIAGQVILVAIVVAVVSVCIAVIVVAWRIAL